MAEHPSKRNKDDDVSFVNVMTEELGIPLGEIALIVQAVIALGQKIFDKKRLLRVQFTDLDHRRLLLRSAKKLRFSIQAVPILVLYNHIVMYT